MTLIELLISISVLGTIAAVIASAMIVTIRQQPVTESRLDVARWEQSLALWLPSDLSSATEVSADKDKVPAGCTTAVCTFGSNALELIWDDGTGQTIVSYRYGPSADGETYELRRVECHGGSCRDLVVLRDLAVPSDDDGNPKPWEPGDDVPDTVINVTVPLAIDSSGSCDPLEDPPDPDCDITSTAKRVIVDVNGAPGVDGVDRSSTVSFTAGGSTRGNLEPASFSGPSFLAANSGCGGPITLVVDNSNSLSDSDIDNVKLGVRSFVNAFEGTPTQLQIITFGTVSKTMGTTGWNKFFDLSDPTDVITLMGPTGTSGLISSIQRNGGTNWEDALHRAYYSENGTPYGNLGNPAAPEPEMVVFFTDGEPTMDRTYANSDSSSVGPDSIPSRFDYSTAGNTNYGADFTPRGWYRADAIVDSFDKIEFIAVGVGSAFDESTRVKRSGWPYTGSWWNKKYTPIPKERFLGDLAVGSGDPSQYPESSGYVIRDFDVDGEWGDVSSANLLVTTDMTKFGGALTEIALAECGGTLTVQTRDQAGDPADAKITYQIDDKVVTTTRIVKAGTFDIPLNGIPSATVDLIPQSFDGTGYTPVSWSCRAGGAPLTQGSDWDLITPGTPGDGISITVTANAAVSCTLSVSP